MKNLFFIALAVIFHAIPVYGQVQGIQEIKVSEPIIGSTTIVYEDSDDHIRFLGIEIKDHTVLCQILIALFLAIAFLQSGFDKIIDRQGNLDFFVKHFERSLLKPFTSIALSILTLMEICGGLLCVFGVIYVLKTNDTIYIFYGLLVIAFTILLLFFGQRVSKDYIGAADLVPYFILTMIAIMSMD